MILIDNLNILKSSYPDTWDRIKEFEDKENRILTEIEETGNGDKTLSITKDDKKVYLHSKYNPVKEAETIVESFDNIDGNTGIIFYGTGLGYHIQQILEEYKDIKYYIYEPIPELLYTFLSNVNLKGLKENRLMGISTNFDGGSMDEFIDRNRNKMSIVALPSHNQNFPEENEGFNEIMLRAIKGKISSIVTDYSFQKRWIINSVKNFKEVLSTPNILLEKKGEFKGKTAILVAAGPSLNEEIENIRYIKENGLAYIFSVGSAINTLIHHDIYPDAATTYDPGVFNQNVFKMAKEKGIKDIPMIFGSSVGYETLNDYLGDKYHMITSQDTVSNYFLKDANDKPINIVLDAPTIAVVTLQLLYELGFTSILLAGQNLAFKGNAQHSEGISYTQNISEEGLSKAITIKDVYGNDILTSDTYISMRNQLEFYIKAFSDIEVINTTKGGAHIEGTTFKELKEIIDHDLKEKIVVENWLDGNKTKYDQEHLRLQLRKMDRAYKKALNMNKEYNIVIEKIYKAINNSNFSQAEKLYLKLVRQQSKTENNDFIKEFIFPMNRVQYKLLANDIYALNDVKDPYEKGKKLADNFRGFMKMCDTDIALLESIYGEMKEAINKFCEMDGDA